MGEIIAANEAVRMVEIFAGSERSEYGGTSESCRKAPCSRAALLVAWSSASELALVFSGFSLDWTSMAVGATIRSELSFVSSFALVLGLDMARTIQDAVGI